MTNFSTYCEKRFTNSGDLQIHVRIHTVSVVSSQCLTPPLLLSKGKRNLMIDISHLQYILWISCNILE